MTIAISPEANTAGNTVENQIDSLISLEKTQAIRANQDRYGNPKAAEVQEIKVFPTHVEVQVKGIVKAVSHFEFKTILDSLLQVNSKLEPLALPYNTFVFARSAAEVQLSCYYPARKATITHYSREEREKKFDVALPNIIISHSLKFQDGYWSIPNYGSNTKYFVTSKSITQLPDKEVIFNADPSRGIYRMPFPNFYDDGHMCFGGNSMPVKFTHNLRGLDYYYQVLLESPFNNDLGLHGVRNYSSARKWFEHLASLDTFDYSLLSNYRA